METEGKKLLSQNVKLNKINKAFLAMLTRRRDFLHYVRPASILKHTDLLYWSFLRASPLSRARARVCVCVCVCVCMWEGGEGRPEGKRQLGRPKIVWESKI